MKIDMPPDTHSESHSDDRLDENSLAQLPRDFLAQITAVYNAQQQAQILSSLGSKRFVSFRINTLKWHTHEADAALTEQGFAIQPVSWCHEARVLPIEQRSELINSIWFDEGKVYVQNLSSMLAPVVLNAKPSQVVLDLAAAPGGKTTMIAAHMQNQGVLSAVEPVKSRFFKLKSILENAGVEIAKCYMMDGRAVGNKTPERFDRILLDAPCSSEARFNTNEPKSWQHWSLRKVKECSKKQKRLLLAAFHALKPGGELVYCTCSFSPQENELVVHSLIKKYPQNVEVLPIDFSLENTMNGLTEWDGKALSAEIEKSVRLIPNDLMDGFYICRIKKRVNA